jgi:hypothetical protein
MRKKLLALLFWAIIGGIPVSNAQMVNYKILKDDPADVTNFWLYLDALHLDMGAKNMDGASFNIGLSSTANYKKHLGGDFIFHYGWMTLGKSGADKNNLNNHIKVELGGFYTITARNKQVSTRVILSSSSSRRGSYTVTTTKSIMVPATKHLALGVRGGFYSVGGIYGTRDIETVPALPSKINYRKTGMYVGLLSASTRNVFINTDTDGKAIRSARTRLYADVLILPVTSAKLNGVNYKSHLDPGVFGFRFGMQVLPVELRKVKDLNVKTKGMSYGVEIGVRPIDGFYIAGNVSFCIMRKKLSILGYEAPASSYNTSE